LAAALLAASALWAQSATDWPEVNGYGSAKYTPLAQITPDNVAKLEVAWTYELEPAQWERRGYNTTPIMVDNVMYFPKDSFKTIVAINATTGEEIWATNLPEVDRPHRGDQSLGGHHGQVRRYPYGRLTAADLQEHRHRRRAHRRAGPLRNPGRPNGL